MTTIIHGVPSNRKYFAIAVPPSAITVSLDRKENEIFTLKDPKTGEENKVEVVEMWNFGMDEFIKMNGWSLLNYELPAIKMSHILRTKYPEIDQTNKVRFVLLKKL
jgi:hypothetical protein